MTPKRQPIAPGYCKNLSLAERVAAIQLRSTHKISTIAKLFGCGQTQVSNVIKSKEATLRKWVDCSNFYQIGLHKRYKTSVTTMDAINDILYTWVTECVTAGLPLLDFTLKAVAGSAANLLNESNFDHGDVWLERFKSEKKIKTVPMNEENKMAGLVALSRIKIEDIIVTLKRDLITNIIEKAYGRLSEVNSKVKKIKTSKSNLSNARKPTKESSIIDANETTSHKLELQNNNILKSEAIGEDSSSNSKSKSSTNVADYCDKDNADVDLGILIKEDFDTDILIKSSDGEKIDIVNLNENTIRLSNADEILDYKAALEYLKPLEDFVLLKCNFKAINYVTQLEDLFKKELNLD